MTISTTERGIEKPNMKMRQRSVSASEAEEVSATNHDRRHPTPLATIHRTAPGSGKSAHMGFRSGKLNSNAATPANTAVATEPIAESQRSVDAKSRRLTAPTSEKVASTTAIAVTIANQAKARATGAGNRRTGVRSAP